MPWLTDMSGDAYKGFLIRVSVDLQGTLVLHLVLLLWDRLPWIPVVVSASAHAAYLQASHTYHGHSHQAASCQLPPKKVKLEFEGFASCRFALVVTYEKFNIEGIRKYIPFS